MIRSIGDWCLDQVFEVVGLIAEHHQRRTIRRYSEDAYRQAIQDATDAHLARARCSRTDCPRRH